MVPFVPHDQRLFQDQPRYYGFLASSLQGVVFVLQGQGIKTNPAAQSLIQNSCSCLQVTTL